MWYGGSIRRAPTLQHPLKKGTEHIRKQLPRNIIDFSEYSAITKNVEGTHHTIGGAK